MAAPETLNEFSAAAPPFQKWIIFVHCDERVPLKLVEIDESHDESIKSQLSLEQLLKQAFRKLNDDAATHMDDAIRNNDSSQTAFDEDDLMLITPTLLIRPRQGDFPTGLSAYTCSSILQKTNNHHANHHDAQPPNVRATRIAMACGLWHVKLRGCVLLAPAVETAATLAMHQTPAQILLALTAAGTYSPDLRESLQQEMMHHERRYNGEAGTTSDDDDDDKLCSNRIIPNWLGNAAMHNYHDQDALDQLAKVMKVELQQQQPCDSDENDRSERRHDGDLDESCSSSESEHESNHEIGSQATVEQHSQHKQFIVATSPLCLQCRRPANTLCVGCRGAYFCNDVCRLVHGWSHECMCSTWKLYVNNRQELSMFAGMGDWVDSIVGRDCQLSNDPYHAFLKRHGIMQESTSWWRTEFGGWSGGDSESAKMVDITKRLSYAEGFGPIIDVPSDGRATADEDTKSARNELGFLRLQSWEDYYRLRNLGQYSIAALLLTFPLTLYYAIVEYGAVPCMVARMLKRPLRIHMVGAEKEMNFLDLFREVSYLLPQNVALELVFIVREDMLPPNLREGGGSCTFSTTLTDGLNIYVQSGSYGDTLDPRFDCGTGAPDMIVGFNAGLYAYPSWRSVVRFLRDYTSVVGVFTDYNEMSAVQCASLGGAASRNSVRMNPFRQPRAMPVYSMNLPQFSNGFLYVYNEQELE
ncbi:hypothetical protein MPSEU_000554800 [Mayamaea pseudoterrestris]|nr:hypothetical protein MPSEU_000554800 [Mayamaea pseudoterrestris]